MQIQNKCILQNVRIFAIFSNVASEFYCAIRVVKTSTTYVQQMTLVVVCIYFARWHHSVLYFLWFTWRNIKICSGNITRTHVQISLTSNIQIEGHFAIRFISKFTAFLDWLNCSVGEQKSSYIHTQQKCKPVNF